MLKKFQHKKMKISRFSEFYIFFQTLFNYDSLLKLNKQRIIEIQDKEKRISPEVKIKIKSFLIQMISFVFFLADRSEVINSPKNETSFGRFELDFYSFCLRVERR